MGHPAFPFIGQGKARVTAKEWRRTREREKKSFRIARSFFSFMRVPPTCRCQQGQLHVADLSVTGATRRRRLPVMAFHSVPVNVVMN